MLSVIIKDNHEPNVIQLTYENTFKELKDIPDSEIVVQDSWLDLKTNNKYVCFLESDCLISSAYFVNQLGLLKKNPHFRKIAMMSSGIGVNNWANKFYGYTIGDNVSNGIVPVKEKKSNVVYPVQIGYVPGALIQVGMLDQALKTLKAKSSWEEDLVYLSTQLSLAFWQQGIGNGVGNRVHLNPMTTYVTTENYVNDIGHFQHDGAKLYDMFKSQAIS